MGDIIYIEEWKQRNKANHIWENLKSTGYDIKFMQEQWEAGEIFFTTHSVNFPVTIIETTNGTTVNEQEFYIC